MINENFLSDTIMQQTSDFDFAPETIAALLLLLDGVKAERAVYLTNALRYCFGQHLAAVDQIKGMKTPAASTSELSKLAELADKLTKHMQTLGNSAHQELSFQLGKSVRTSAQPEPFAELLSGLAALSRASNRAIGNLSPGTAVTRRRYVDGLIAKLSTIYTTLTGRPFTHTRSEDGYIGSRQIHSGDFQGR